jgi:ribonuclease P protein subunit RPR2
MAGKSGRGAKPEWQKKLARERIEKLFSMAESSFKKNPERSHRYVHLARRIAMRYNIRIPGEMKTRFCRKCYKYLKPSINSTVRTRTSQEAVIVTCLECGHVMRYPYRREKSRRK